MRLVRTSAGPGDGALAARHLSAAEFELWARLSGRDRGHSVRVLRRLLAAGEPDALLLKAALLHDIGKAVVPVRLWHRIALVLLEAAGEPWPSRLARADGRAWSRTLEVLHRHAAIGAELARAAGSEPALVDLIARHDGPIGDDRRLRRLRRADRD